MRLRYLLPLVPLIAGCGVEWFPTVTAPPTPSDAAPTFLNFSSQSVTIAQIAASTTGLFPSKLVTLEGTSSAGWPITFQNFSGIKAELEVGDSVAGLTLFYSPGDSIPNVFPKDTLQISQQPALKVGSATVSQVKVGTRTANFVLTTR
jgi:hypothetical protein